MAKDRSDVAAWCSRRLRAPIHPRSSACSCRVGASSKRQRSPHRAMTARADPVKLARVVALSWRLLFARRGAAPARGTAEAAVMDSNNRPCVGGVVGSFLVVDQPRLDLQGVRYDTMPGSDNESPKPSASGLCSDSWLYSNVPRTRRPDDLESRA